MRTALDSVGLSDSFFLTKHAAERIRQRVGIDSGEVAEEWVRNAINTATNEVKDGDITRYITDFFEIITNGLKVVTIKPTGNERSYLDVLGAAVEKEVTKMLAKKERELRKVEIVVAEHTLNRLKARNPNTRALIGRRLTRAVDERQRLMDDLYAIKKAAGQYGVEIE